MPSLSIMLQKVLTIFNTRKGSRRKMLKAVLNLLMEALITVTYLKSRCFTPQDAQKASTRKYQGLL